jgi:hypothetical protein
MNQKSGVSQIRGHEQEFRSKVDTYSGLLPRASSQITDILGLRAICNIE